MMFKKGSFEIGATVYPVAIKVQARPLRGHVVVTADAMNGTQQEKGEEEAGVTGSWVDPPEEQLGLG